MIVPLLIANYTFDRLQSTLYKPGEYHGFCFLLNICNKIWIKIFTVRLAQLIFQKTLQPSTTKRWYLEQVESNFSFSYFIKVLDTFHFLCSYFSGIFCNFNLVQTLVLNSTKTWLSNFHISLRLLDDRFCFCINLRLVSVTK